MSSSASRLHQSGRVSMSLQPALHLLGYKLHVASIKKEALSTLTHSLLQVLLQLFSRDAEARRNRFFSYTETAVDYSVVVDSKLIQALTSGTGGEHIEVASSVWRPLVVEVGALGALNGISKIAASVIAPLANQKVSVFCLSTNQDDYVLVREEQLEDALTCLAQRFRIISDSSEPSDNAAVERIVKRSNPTDPGGRLNVACSSRPITHPYSCSETFYTVCSVVPQALPSVAATLLELMFYNQRLTVEEAFFSLTIVEEDISLVIDSRLLQKFPDDALYCSEGVWRLLRIGDGPLGFDECGIVAQVSAPLAQAEISTYYICTFYTDQTLLFDYTNLCKTCQSCCHGDMVPSDTVEKALALLNANKCSRSFSESERLSSGFERGRHVITSGSLR